MDFFHPSDPQPSDVSPREREERLALALHAANVGTWSWSSASELLDLDDCAQKIFGLGSATFGRSYEEFLNLVHPEDRARLHSHITECHAGVGDFNSEYRIIWPSDGTTHFVRSRGKIDRDKDGRTVRMTGACWDITERKKIEADLAYEQHLLRTLLETMPEVIYFKDVESRFVRTSRAHVRKCGGESPSQMIGKTDFEFFSEEHARQAFEDEQTIMRTGIPILDLEEKETWPDGHITWVSTTKMPLRDPSGKIIGTFGLSRDITARKEAEAKVAKYTEELRRKNKELEEDLEMARELQNALLPQRYPRFPQESTAQESALKFSHFFNPTAAVSGDFFDIFNLSDTVAGIFICDVMGHGVRAALVAAIVRALVEEQRSSGDEPGEFLLKLNRTLLSVLPQAEVPMFASAFYVVANIATGELHYANAGHPSPVCIRHEAGGARAEQLNHCKRGPVLGMFPHAEYDTASCPLSIHDMLLLFTDGLFEVEGAGGEYYDQQQLLDAVNQRTDLSAIDLCKEILVEIQQFSASKAFTDDVCLVTMEVDRLALPAGS